MQIDPSSPPLAEPLAYFLTWTTYGTWLSGDERGWVRKPGIIEPPSSGLQRHARQQQTEVTFRLSLEQRRIVEDTIAAHCRIRGWHLWIARALSNHIHVVVTAREYAPEVVMEQFKAWCTRRLKENNTDSNRTQWWTERGSTRFIDNEDGLENAVVYVQDCQ